MVVTAEVLRADILKFSYLLPVSVPGMPAIEYIAENAIGNVNDDSVLPLPHCATFRSR